MFLYKNLFFQYLLLFQSQSCLSESTAAIFRQSAGYVFIYSYDSDSRVGPLLALLVSLLTFLIEYVTVTLTSSQILSFFPVIGAVFNCLITSFFTHIETLLFICVETFSATCGLLHLKMTFPPQVFFLLF